MVGLVQKFISLCLISSLIQFPHWERESSLGRAYFLWKQRDQEGATACRSFSLFKVIYIIEFTHQLSRPSVL